MSRDELIAAQAKANENMQKHWSVNNGLLVFDGKGENLCTEKDYRDFELMIDWKIDRAGDSGIYLRGTPQVQIWDTEYEPYFEMGANKGSGALWNNKIHSNMPLVTADKSAGQWNTFRIRMLEDKVTVWLNDNLVVDNVILENYWEPEKPLYRTGPIELQNHDSKLYFKNIFIKEL